MKKIVTIIIFALLISFTIPTELTTDEKENIQVNKEEATSIDKVYDTWKRPVNTSIFIMIVIITSFNVPIESKIQKNLKLHML